MYYSKQRILSSIMSPLKCYISHIAYFSVMIVRVALAGLLLLVLLMVIMMIMIENDDDDDAA